MQENGRKQGILLMLPVWEEDTGEPVSATPRSLLGFATGVFRIDGTVRQAFSAKALERMDIEIVDGGASVRSQGSKDSRRPEVTTRQLAQAYQQPVNRAAVAMFQ